jgi:cell division septal protein FtsQ
MNTAFLPDRFRPRPPHRRSSRPWVALVTLAAIPLVIPWWRVQAIEVNGFPGLPDTVTRSLEDLVGGFPLLVDPQWVRQQVEVWPVVETVDVRLELPGTLTVSATQVTPEGCLSVGRGWQAVAADGTLAGPLTSPLPPILTGFPHRPQELRRALGVARRLESASGARAEAVRFVTPTDFEVELRLADGTAAVVHVQPEETAGERFWCRCVLGGDSTMMWADLRWDDRVVAGGAS